MWKMSIGAGIRTHNLLYESPSLTTRPGLPPNKLVLSLANLFVCINMP